MITRRSDITVQRPVKAKQIIKAKENFHTISYQVILVQIAKLTWALPLRTAGVCINQDRHAQQTALRLGGVVATVERRVVKQQLSIETDQLNTLINAIGVWGLWMQIYTFCF